MRGEEEMNLEDRLKTYKEKCARIEVLKLEIEGLRERLQHTGIHETDEETIEGMMLRRTPDGTGTKSYDSRVERVALKYKDEQEELSQPEDITYLYEQIRAKEGELKRLEEEVLPIQKALEGITDKQRLVVTEFYIKGNTWYTVGTKHQQAFGNYIGRDTCRKIRDEALRKIRRILGE
jgi:hypothetical protein